MTFALIVTDRTGGLADEKAERDSVRGGISGECPGEDKGSAVPNAPGHRAPTSAGGDGAAVQGSLPDGEGRASLERPSLLIFSLFLLL